MSSAVEIYCHRFGRVTVLFFRLLLKETVILLSTIIIIFHPSFNRGVHTSKFFLHSLCSTHGFQNCQHVHGPDQARCDYPGVALWFFSRDYRAYREKRLDKAGVTPASILKTPETLYVPVSVVFDVIMRSPVIGVVEHWAKVSIEIPEESNSKRRE